MERKAIQWLVASGRDLGDIKNKKGKNWDGEGWKEYTSLEIARKHRRSEVASVLERFMINPVLTRHELRVKLGVLDKLAAEAFFNPPRLPNKTLHQPFDSLILLPNCPWSYR